MNILLVASPGGHFVQMSLVAEGFKDHNIVVASTYPKKPTFMPGDSYEQLPDFSRHSCFRFFPCFYKAVTIIKKHCPDLIITTGAAPGLVMILAAKIFRVKAVWVDSLANSKRLSLSGRLAERMRVDTLTQWPDVAKNAGGRYEGRVI